MKKEIVRDLNFLRKPCETVKEGENLKSIIQDLRDSLDPTKGYGLSANQISYNKRVFIVKFPKIDPKTKQVSYDEEIIINPKIIDKRFPFRFQGEGCLSLPGLKVDTLRYNFIQVEYLTEKYEPKKLGFVGLKGIIFQHESQHLLGKTILDYKYRNTKT